LEKAHAAETSRLISTLTGKDEQINALLGELQLLQRMSAAELDQRESEYISKVDLINDLNARMADLQRTAELKQLKVELSGKNNQITELKRRNGELHQRQGSFTQRVKQNGQRT